MLGQGGFGRTYLAADHGRFGELCVLKEFIADGGNDRVMVAKLRELFRREAAILHRLNHPQIPQFHAWFEQDRRLFIVQEYVDGKTYWQLLVERRRQGQAFSTAEVMRWLWDLLRVLTYVHQQKIVHRDISPENVMLPTGKKLPVLIDFGVVQQVATQIQRVSTEGSSSLIQGSVAVGKFGYSPAEQIRLGQCSPRSDLYALGVTAVVLLTGQRPNALIDPKSLDWKWHAYAPVDLRLKAILDTMMAEKPQDRYPSAQAVLADLHQLLQAAKVGGLTVPTSDGRAEGSLATTVFQQDTMAGALAMGTSPPGALTAGAFTAGTFTAADMPLESLTPSTHLELADRPYGVDAPTAVGQAAIVSTLQEQAAPPPSTWSDRPTIHGSVSKWLTHPWHPSVGRLMAIASLTILPVVGAFVGIQSPYISALCVNLGNCAREQEFTERYRQLIEQADAAQGMAREAKTLAALQSVRDRLQQSIQQLQTLPSDVGIHRDAQRMLWSYENQLRAINDRLQQENQIAETLAQIEAKAQAAIEITKIAATVQDYRAARDQWQEAMAALRELPTETLMYDQARARLQAYGTSLGEVNRRIAELEGTGDNGSAIAQPGSALQQQPTTSGQTSSAANSPRPAASQPTAAATSRQPSSNSQATRATSPQAAAQAPAAAPRAVAAAPTTQPVAPTTGGNYTTAQVALMAHQVLNQVTVRLDGARVSPSGTFVANLVIDNQSDRPFGFVPLFAEVQDAAGQPVRSRIFFDASGDVLAQPGSSLRGQVYVLEGTWTNSGPQDLFLVIREGTSGGRTFRISF